MFDLSLRRDFSLPVWLVIGASLGVYAALISITSSWKATALMLIPVTLVATAWWSLGKSHRWFVGFSIATLLFPPLPIALGDTAPHPAILFAAFGLWAALARLPEWSLRNNGLTIISALLLLVLTASVALAGLHSGWEVAAGSFARVALFAIAIFTLFYFAYGPGLATGSDPTRLVRRLYGLGVASALFACVDFYFQWPPPAGFGEQYVWLPAGVFRRAQGVFYDAGMLGNLCAFFLIMMAIAWVRPDVGRRLMPRKALLAGGVILSAALLFSFSRSSLLCFVVGLAVLLYLHRTEIRLRRWFGIGFTGMTGGLLVTYSVFPAFVESYVARLGATVTGLFASPETLLSGRLESWHALVAFLAAHPGNLLTGIGFKTLPYSDSVGQALIADNMYLSMLVETGVFGLLLMLLFHAAVLKAAYHAARSVDAWTSFLGTWVFCFWVGELFQMLSVDALTYWRVLPIYFAVLGLAVRESNLGLSRAARSP